MDTWTIRYTETTGEATQLDPMAENEAKSLLDGVRRLIDPAAELVDVVEEARLRLPVGSRIRHTEKGYPGTVVEDDASCAPFSGAPAGTRISHYASSKYTAVCVRFDHRGYPEWFDDAFIAPLNGESE